ncbi:MAG TPA: hypothetical protein DCF33_18120 [Saprospirales bacterium]|nr:hypothetical protein [Saprospirales bacterium]
MKHILLTAFVWLQLLAFNQAQTYQDTTFTDPVVISFAPDFVTFKNCRFVGIDGIALTIEGSGVFVSDCTFEDITGTAVYALLSEVYLLRDTISHVSGTGVLAEFGAMVVLESHISDIGATAVQFSSVEVAEVTDCRINRVGAGISCIGADGIAEAIIKNTEIKNVVGDGGDPSSEFGLLAQNLLSIQVVNCRVDSCLGAGMIFGSVDGIGGIQSANIQQNKISHTGQDGLVGFADVANTVIQQNEISYITSFGGFFGASGNCLSWQGPDVRIESNHIHHSFCGQGQSACGAGIEVGSSANLAKNLIHNIAGDGILYSPGLASGTGDVTCFNNIVYDAAGYAFHFDGDELAVLPPNTIIRNNTFHVVQPKVVRISNLLDAVQLEGNILIAQNFPDTSQYIETDQVANFTASLNIKSPGDPGFVNFDGRDFHLANETSPAHKILPANFGLPNDDFDGEIRLGLRDAGADEFESEEAICGCNNCPSNIEDFFTGDFTFSVISAANNDLSTSAQGVCGVRVEFEHQYLGDLSMTLISPAGQQVQLIGPSGFFGGTADSKWNIGLPPCLYPASPDPGFSAVWNSDQLWGQSGSFSGIYYPAVGCLEEFNQGTVTGDWTLRVSDNQSSDDGTVLGFEVLFCDLEEVNCFLCSDAPTAGLNATNVGPWGITMVSTTTGSPTGYQIDFGDGQTGFNLPTFHEYENPGTYLVRLIASNECGIDTTYVPVQISGGPPVAFVSVSPEEGCTPLTISTNIILEDHVDTWHWFFPGGVPSESFEKTPVVVYPQTGIFTISLEITNEIGTTEISEVTTLVLTDSLLNPTFNVQVAGNVIQVTNTTQGAQSFFWSINGGTPQGLNTSPFLFEVNASGVYTVALTATNECGVSINSSAVTVMLSSVTPLEAQGWQIVAAPNPNKGLFQVQINAPVATSGTLSLFNTIGEEVISREVSIQSGEQYIPVDLEAVAAGTYLLQVQTPSGIAQIRVVKVE